MNSSGSAIAENEKYLDSIAGKSELLSNSMQTLWNNTINSDVIKFFLDFANSAVKVVDKVGLIPTTLAAVFVYLKAFKTYLKALRLSDQTIQAHIRHANLYINDFLLLYEVHPLYEGCYMLDEFFMDWTSKNDLLLSENLVKGITASVKKFYAYMLELGLEINAEHYKVLCESISKHKAEWIEKHSQ